MKVRYDSYCGLNCGACPVGLANETNNTDGIKQMATDWGAEVSDLKCHGCKTEQTTKFCASCAMRNCAREKQLEFCYQCVEFACKDLADFRNDKAPHHSAVFSNLESIERIGIEAWLERIMNADMKRNLTFTNELEKLKTVTWQNHTLDANRQENSAEHS